MGDVIEMSETPAAARRDRAKMNAIKCRLAGLSRADQQRVCAELAKGLLRNKEALAANPGLKERCEDAVARFGGGLTKPLTLKAADLEWLGRFLSDAPYELAYSWYHYRAKGESCPFVDQPEAKAAWHVGDDLMLAARMVFAAKQAPKGGSVTVELTDHHADMILRTLSTDDGHCGDLRFAQGKATEAQAQAIDRRGAKVRKLVEAQLGDMEEAANG